MTLLTRLRDIMSYQSILTIALIFLTCSGSRTVNADLALSMTPNAASYNIGDSGFIDVLISSNSADALDSYLYGLNITGGNGIVFSDPQSESFLSDGNYVFSGRSSNVNNALPASLVGGGGSTIAVADVSYDPASLPFPGDPLPFVLPGAGLPALLARIEFEAVSAGIFNVDFDPGSSFSDVNFANFNFTSSGANITVNAAAVPEPATITLVCVTGLVGGVMRYRRRRKAGAEQEAIHSDS